MVGLARGRDRGRATIRAAATTRAVLVLTVATTSEATATQACGSCVGGGGGDGGGGAGVFQTAAKILTVPKAVKDSHLLRLLPRKLSVLGVLGVAAKSSNVWE